MILFIEWRYDILQTNKSLHNNCIVNTQRTHSRLGISNKPFTGGPRYMRTFYLQFRIYVIKIM